MAKLGSHDASSGPRKVRLGTPWALEVEEIEDYERQVRHGSNRHRHYH